MIIERRIRDIDGAWCEWEMHRVGSESAIAKFLSDRNVTTLRVSVSFGAYEYRRVA